MKTKKRKSRNVKIQEAVDALNKAMAMDDKVHFRIWLPYGLDGHDPKAAELLREIKKGIVAYKEYYRLDKVEVEFVV